MVLTGLPADGKASFCIAPHCGFRYRKRRFYRILMLLARYDGHMNPVFEKPEITSKSQSMHGRGCENHVPRQNMYPRTRKSRIPDAQSQSTHERGHQSGVPSRNTYPVSEKPGKPIQIALIHKRGPRQNNHKSHPPAETANLQYRDSQQILRDASRLCGASRQSRLHRTVQNLGRSSQLNRLVDQIAIIRRKPAFRQTVARNRH